MQLRGIFILLFIGLAYFVAAQPVLELNQYQEEYPGIPALILEENIEFHFEINDDTLSIYKTFYQKIFYLSDVSGYWKEMEIGYSTFSEIIDVEAKTLIPGKNKYKTVKVKEFKNKDDLSNEIFHDDYQLITFNYSGLQKGSISELSYTRIQHDPHLPGAEFMQSAIPIKHKTISIIADKRIALGIGEFNLESIDVDYTRIEDKNNIIYKWELNNIEALKNESASPSYAWYGAHIIPYVKNYTVNNENHIILGDVNDLFNWYNSFIGDLNNGLEYPEMQALVDSITLGAETDLEKVKQIFYWTQDNIKYIAIEYGMGGFIPRQANLVCTNRYGDCKDMASTITGMLDYAGINSHLTWIGTNDIPYTYSDLPTPNVDNHMIATYIDKDNRYYFLDATGRYSNFDIPSSFIQGKQALIRKNQNEFEIVTVPVVDPDQNKISEKIYLNIENNNLIGLSKASISGYNKTRLQYAIENKTKEEKLKYYKLHFSKGHNKFIFEDFTEDNFYPIEKPLEIEYKFSVNDYILLNKDEMYINLNLENMLSGQQIDDDRQTPLQNDYPLKLDNTIELEIPEGWKVDYIPENLTIDDPHIAFNSNYEIKDGKIILHQETAIRYLNMTHEYFKKWNENVNEILKYQNEIVILKQAND
jgi:hypothetical protein